MRWFASIVLVLNSWNVVEAEDAAATRQRALAHSYGTYDGNLRTPNGHIDHERLLVDLGELRANTYNWLIWHPVTDWDDLHTFLPLARKQGIRLLIPLLPTSESPPRT